MSTGRHCTGIEFAKQKTSASCNLQALTHFSLDFIDAFSFGFRDLHVGVDNEAHQAGREDEEGVLVQVGFYQREREGDDES